MSYKLEITDVIHYTDSLFKIRTNRPKTFKFDAGEFVMIGLDEKVKRAYSLTSGPYDDFLEFYSIKVPNGLLTSRLKNVKIGDTILMNEKPTGTLTLSNLELGGDLWMMATGTGIAPFISLLRDPFTYDYFNKIHVSWTVRKKKDLESYDSFLREMDVNYFPTVTQEEFENKGRIQSFIDKKQFFQDTSPNNDKVMICGSLNFNDDIKNLLLQKGWEEGNKKTAGNFVVEKAFVGEGVN